MTLRVRPTTTGRFLPCATRATGSPQMFWLPSFDCFVSSDRKPAVSASTGIGLALVKEVIEERIVLNER